MQYTSRLGGDRRLGSNDRLPVDPERLDNRNFLEDDRQLPRIRFSNLPEMDRYLPKLLVDLIVEIQNQADRSELRTFAMNLFGHNRFANNMFADLAQLFANMVEMICVRDNADPAQVIEAEVEPFMIAATAFLVGEYPALEAYVPNDYAGQVREEQRVWANMIRQVEGYLRQVSGGGRGREMEGRGLGESRDRDRGFNSGMISRSEGGRLGGGRSRDIRPEWEMNDNNGGGQNTRGGQDASSTGFNAGHSLRRSPLGRADSGRDDSGEVLARGDTPSSVGLRSSAARRMPEVETRPLKGREEPKAAASVKYDRVEMKGDRVAVPAFKSGLHVTPSPERPPLVYNLETHMLYHVKDKEGNVTEELVPIVPEMDYLRHELDDKLKQVFKANNALFDTTVTMPELLETRKLIPNATGTIATQVTEEKRKQLDAADAPRTLTRTIPAASLEEAKFLATVEATREGNESEFLEYQVEELRETNQSHGALKVVLGLRECKSFEELHKQLGQLHKTDLIDDAFFQLLDRRLTVAFNRYQSKQLYLGYSVDSFFGDFEELTGFIRERLGQSTLDRLLGGHKTVIARALSVLTGQHLSKYLSNLPEEARKVLDEPAIFTNRYSVTELPWTMQDMASAWKLEGVVTQENAKEFHQALSAIFNRTKTNDVHEHLLLTADGQIIYSYPGVVMPDTFTITVEPPVLDTSFFKKVKDLT